MNKHKQALFQAVLARISLGAVPVDGVYWFDPKDARAAAPAPPPAPDTGRSPGSTLPGHRHWGGFGGSNRRNEIMNTAAIEHLPRV